MGILDGLDPTTAGILSAAFQGLQSSGPSRMPMGLGQIFGQAGSAGLGTYSSTLEAQRKAQQTQALIDLEKQKGNLTQMQVQALMRSQSLQDEFLKQLMGIQPNPAAQYPATQTLPRLLSPGEALSGTTDRTAAAAAATQAPSGGPLSAYPAYVKQAIASDVAFNGGKGVHDILMKYHTPIPARAGAPVIDPGTGQVLFQNAVQVPGITTNFGAGGVPQSMAPIPGFREASQAIREAESRGTAMGSFHPVTSASGATIPTLGANIPGLPSPATTPRPMTPAAAPGDPWATMPKRQIPQGMGQTTFDKGIAEKQANEAAALTTKYGASADTANQRIALSTQALDLVDKATTGPFAAKITDVQNLLVSRFGIPENDFKTSDTIALQKDLVNAATQKAKQQFGSRITQSEVNLMLTRGAPNVDMTKAAMKYLISTDIAQAQYQVKQASDLGKYISGGGDPLRFEGWYSQSFPMSKALGAIHMGGTLSSVNSAAVPATGAVVKGYKFKGGDPSRQENWAPTMQGVRG